MNSYRGVKESLYTYLKQQKNKIIRWGCRVWQGGDFRSRCSSEHAGSSPAPTAVIYVMLPMLYKPIEMVGVISALSIVLG